MPEEKKEVSAKKTPNQFFFRFSFRHRRYRRHLHGGFRCDVF